MYDYRNAMINDIKEYLADNKIKVTKDNREELEDRLNDELFVEDSVTGNASGSYTFNRWQAEENVKDNIKLCIDALTDFGISAEEFGKRLSNEEYEYLDVTIRCYLLGECLHEALDELEKVDEVLQGLGQAEKVIREKLTFMHRDNFNDSDWTDTFDFGTTDEIISQLYDSYCDDVFWANANITLSELFDYFDETESDEEERDRLFGRIAHSYIFCKYTDLLR